MKRFWTADMHLNHGNVLAFSNRPFRDARHMREAFVREFNQRVRPDDTVIHVGDFMCRGNERGVPPQERLRQREAERQFHGSWVFVAGNHDKNNGVLAHAHFMYCRVGPYLALVTHMPTEEHNRSWFAQFDMWFGPSPDFVICGHVHNAWRTKFVEMSWGEQRLHVNVGVDANDYRPLADYELVGIAEHAWRSRGISLDDIRTRTIPEHKEEECTVPDADACSDAPIPETPGNADDADTASTTDSQQSNETP